MLRFFTDLFKPKSAPPPPPVTSEASMNFDAAEVAPFLTRLSNHPQFTFPANMASEVGDTLATIAVDDTKRWRLTCAFDGEDISMDIEVFMDDIDAPDLYFFSTQEAIAVIEQELETFAEEKGL
ncbi:hypothetical protein J7382_10700 [Shimia sp. R11_0]|uniref:hypothetical protein n=1 Tax=Shimia sp. R11_0 TaxID=2821096 RepID=UPI001ADD47BA|nr:hypothetical protein [Shimia sp. R11_0]MBO9478005.1 hypothetical protein [Shimia sp. R11_0]